MGSRLGLVLTAFGGIRSPQEVRAYLARVMGRDASEERVRRLEDKVGQIGGSSPLPDFVERVAHQVRSLLQEKDLPVRWGLLHSPPYLSEVLEELSDGEMETVI